VPPVRPWQPDPNGAVSALAGSDTTVYLGGDFTHVRGTSDGSGPERLNLAAVAASAAAGANDAELRDWNPIAAGGVDAPDAGTVTALATSAAGVFAGGSFTSIGARPHANLAALGSDGALIDEWAPATDGPVHALAAGNDRVYVGGDFGDVGGVARRRLAAVSASGAGAADTTFQAGAECEGAGCAAAVLSLSLADATLYVGGAFTSLGGVARSNLGAVDAVTGATRSDWAPAPDGTVHALLATCGTVYAGGGFANIGGLSRARLAALDPASGMATAWDPNVQGGTVFALARDAELVYAGGRFAEVGGKPRSGLAALDTAAGDATSWNPDVPGIGDVVRAIAVPAGGSVVYAGGRFTRAGRADRLNLAAFDRVGGDATDWNPGADAPVRALAAGSESLLVGGEFRGAGGLMQQGIGSFGLGSGTAQEALRCASPPPPEEPPPPEPEPEPMPEPPPAPRPVRDGIAPELTGFRLTNRRFRSARTPRRRVRAARTRRPPVGTRFRYRLSEAAVVRFSFERRVKVRCASAKAKKPCYRWRTGGAIGHLSPAGAAKLRFLGRVGRRWLAPGRYRVTARAVDLAGNGSAGTTRVFTVARR
jgi:hypothetical protein